MRRADPAELEHMLERFDYSRVGAEWAVVRLLARLGGELGAPGDARLEVTRPDRSAELFQYPARACGLERRLIGRTLQSPGGSELLWRAAFALPLEIVECGDAVFSLTANGFALALPAPGIRIVTARALALTPPGRGRAAQPAWHELGAARRRLVALATAVAVTAGSTPAAALADASTGGGSGATSGTTTGGAADPTGTGATTDTGTTTGTGGTGTTGATDTGTGTTGTGTTGTGATGAGTTGTGTTGTGTGGTTTGTTGGGTGTTSTDPTGTGTTGVGTTGTVTTTGTNTTGTSAPGAGGGASGGSTTSSDAPHGTSTQTSGARGSERSAHTPAGHRHKRGSSTATCLPPVANPVAVTASGRRARPAKETSRATTTAVGAAQPTVTCVTTSTGAHRHGGTSSGGSAPGKTSGPVPGYGNTLGSWAEATHPTGEGRAAHRRASTGGAGLSTLTKRPPVGLPNDRDNDGDENGVPTLSPTPSGFLAPKAWTGTVMADPTLTGAVTNLSGLLSNGDRPPSFLVPIYMEAGRRYGVPWEVLASINAIESDYGRDLSTSTAGAIGWMQFEPSTWREYGRATDGHSVPNPYDPRDAIFAAARYLAAAGARHDIARAVFAYNHANWYVQEVLSRAAAIASHAQYERQTVKHGVFSVYFATGVRTHPTVRYHSGVLSHFDRLIAAANMVSAANFPYLYGGGHEQPALFGPFDCSGSVSYVMQQAGYKVPTTVSGEIPIWKFPSGPGKVTIFYNPTHTFMRVGNRFFGTSGFARPGGGAGWFDVNRLPAAYLAQFREVHVPRLGVNSFAPPAPRHDGRVHRR